MFKLVNFVLLATAFFSSALAMPNEQEFSDDVISSLTNLRVKRELLKELLGVDLPVVPGVVAVSKLINCAN